MWICYASVNIKLLAAHPLLKLSQNPVHQRTTAIYTMVACPDCLKKTVSYLESKTTHYLQGLPHIGRKLTGWYIEVQKENASFFMLW